MATLIVTAGPLVGTRFPLEHPAVLGRGALADVDLADSAVSRRHAMLTPAGPAFRVADLQSGNGTFLNGQAVTGAITLVDGDELRLGSTQLVYRDAREAAPQAEVEDLEELFAAESGDSIIIPLAASPAITNGQLELEVELRLLRRRLDSLAAVAEAMSRSTEVDELLSSVLRLVMRALPQADRACVAIPDPLTGMLSARIALERSGAAARMALSQKMLRSAMTMRQAVLVKDTGQSSTFPGQETVFRLGLRSIMCLPLIVGSEVFGALQVDTIGEGQPFDSHDLDTLAGVAPSIGLAIANSQLHGRLLAYELEMRDLDLARRVQQQFLPEEPPSVPGFDFAFRCNPALAVGGDFFEFLPLPSGRLGIVIGDVAGKGVSAALLMARVMSDLRFIAGQGLAAGDMMVRLSRLLAGATREAMFATVLYLELDPATGNLEMANAGHPLPLLRHRDGQVITLELPRGVPAGVRLDAVYRTHRAQLRPGEAVLVYTDGITEAVAASGERFGDERLEAVLTATASADAIATGVVAAVAAWQIGCPPADDLTLVCLQRH